MAVMTSQHPEGVALEQKIQPVPSSDEMALDLEINGTSNRDETTLDAASTESDAFTAKPVDPSPLTEFTSSALSVNGATNDGAFASNATIETTAIMPPSLESQPTELSTSAVDSSQLADTITTTTSEVQQASTEPELQFGEPSTLLASADAAINAALDDVAASSTVPPVVEAQESDLRSTTPPPAPGPTADLLPTGSVVETAETLVEAEVAGISLEPSDSVLPPSSSNNETLQRSTANPDLDLDSPLPTEQDQDTTLNVATDVDFDTEMADAPQPPPSSKVPREREDDDESERSAKRTKTEDESIVIETADAAPVQNGESAQIKSEASPITSYEAKEIIKILKNVARTSDGKNFRAPVDQLWPGVAELYASKISNQIDLATIEKKLRENTYPTMDDFKADIQLLEDNAITFNGAEHTVSKSARNVRDSILSKTSKIPPEPVAAPKKEKKPKRSTPVGDTAARAPPARRQSRGAAGTSSADAPPAQTFALDPQTSTPLIRRDSTKGDGGRPKREIHPPKNKDLVYSVRPKSKKFATELKWCEEVLNELKKPKYFAFSSAFMNPVDPVALGIPTYFKIIKTPMDISKVTGRLNNGEYASSKEFEKDMGLIFSNCYKFNPEGNVVREWGKQLEEVYNAQLAKKTQWIADHAPAAASLSPTPDSEEEESDDEPEVPANNGSTVATKRLVEEQAKLIELMNDKDTDPSIVQMQKDMVNIVQKRVDAEAAVAAASAKKTKKPKAPKAAKKAAPAKKPPAAAKKSGGNRQSQKYLGTLEKEVISVGISSLPEELSGKVLDMIKMDQPGVDIGDDGTLELDIDAISVPTLWKIYNMVIQHAPQVEPELRRQFQERDAPRAPAKPATKKKNKPMSKVEQERKIEQLKSAVQDFERQGSGSQEPLPTVENHDDSSGDEDSDSEEE